MSQVWSWNGRAALFDIVCMFPWFHDSSNWPRNEKGWTMEPGFFWFTSSLQPLCFQLRLSLASRRLNNFSIVGRWVCSRAHALQVFTCFHRKGMSHPWRKSSPILKIVGLRKSASEPWLSMKSTSPLRQYWGTFNHFHRMVGHRRFHISHIGLFLPRGGGCSILYLPDFGCHALSCVVCHTQVQIGRKGLLEVRKTTHFLRIFLCLRLEAGWLIIVCEQTQQFARIHHDN